MGWILKVVSRLGVCRIGAGCVGWIYAGVKMEPNKLRASRSR